MKRADDEKPPLTLGRRRNSPENWTDLEASPCYDDAQIYRNASDVRSDERVDLRYRGEIDVIECYRWHGTSFVSDEDCS
jgi:hypothetical protein